MKHHVAVRAAFCNISSGLNVVSLDYQILRHTPINPMTTLHLCFDQIVQGSFDLKPFNLLFVFQVNCPGCFIYGFPLVNQLFWRYQESNIGVFGLATAFEDFEYNTPDNVKRLLMKQETVGMTRHSIGEQYPQPIDFPIAIDRPLTEHDLSSPQNLDVLKQAIAHFDDLPASQQESIRQQLHRYVQHAGQTSATFMLNRLPGTPTFLLVDQTLEIKESWFGHQPEARVIELLDHYASRDNYAARDTDHVSIA